MATEISNNEIAMVVNEQLTRLNSNGFQTLDYILDSVFIIRERHDQARALLMQEAINI